MSSIIVKGMKMPELYETYKVNFAKTNDGKIVMGMCPLNETGYRPVGEVIALPDHHGRLVDVTTAHQDTMRYSNRYRESVLKIIDAFPTVVEAEEET